MELTYSAMRARLQAYMKENFGTIAVVLFVFVAGVASGLRIVLSMYREQAAEIIRILPGMLRADGIPWLQCFMLSLFSHALCVGMIMLSGLWLPAAIFWVIGILLRGMLIGAAIGASVAAWPAASSIVLLIVLQIEAAVLLPPLIRLSVISQNEFSAACKKKLGISQVNAPFDDYMELFLKACLGLIPAIFVQCVIAPSFLMLFCN